MARSKLPMSENPCLAAAPETHPTGRGAEITRLRPWIQTVFLGVWLAPVGKLLHSVPGCVFHCYSCPLSAFACPVGVAANYAALFPAVWEVPWVLMGILLLVAAVVGTAVCSWACPFGFLQDLLAKITKRKVQLPLWLGHTRYVVLVGLVVLLPMVLGYKGVAFEDQTVSICRLCPAGALEAGLPYSVQSVLAGKGWLMSWFKTGLLAVFLISAVVIYRPWCRIFCPLGGGLALFNRWSLFHLRFNGKACVECNLCRSRCPVGVHLDQKVNVVNCIRCLECTKCSAIEPGFALPGAAREGKAPPAVPVGS